VHPVLQRGEIRLAVGAGRDDLSIQDELMAPRPAGHAGEPRTLRAAWTARGNSRQHSTAALVDRYGIAPGGVRDVLVDYLGELRQSLDYSSLETKAYILGRLFWRSVLDAEPAQETLRLDRATITAWRERLAVTAGGRPRTDVYSALFTVRGFYRDLQQWAAEDPVRWGIWAAPSPVRDSDCGRSARRSGRSELGCSSAPGS
jgi:hypothetical protein